MWKILNIKIPDAGRNLNDGDREKFTTTDDPRLEFLLKMGHSFKLMDGSKRGHRVRCLTSETANALHETLIGIGIYPGSSGGNYFISPE